MRGSLFVCPSPPMFMTLQVMRRPRGVVGYPFRVHVNVLYFGLLKDLLRRDREQFELPDAASVAALIVEIRTSRNGDDRLWNSLAIAVNQVYAQRDHLLHEGDEVALLPPVSGGIGL